MSNEMERINTRVSKEQAQWLEMESEKKGMSKSQLIMLAIEHYMNYSIELRLRMKVLDLEKE